jgi:hypothetical protein
LPSGKFTANAAWLVLVVIAFNLTRVAATIAGTDLAKATTATIRRTLIVVPARVAVLGPANRAAPADGMALAGRVDPTAHPQLRAADHRRHLTPQPNTAPPDTEVEHPDSEVRNAPMPSGRDPTIQRSRPTARDRRWIEA